MIQFGEFTLDNFQLLMLRHTVYHSELLQRAPVDWYGQTWSFPEEFLSYIMGICIMGPPTPKPPGNKGIV